MIAGKIQFKNQKTIYAIIYGHEHFFPPHAIFSYNKKDGKPGIKIDLEKLVTMKKLNGGLAQKTEKQILAYLGKNPKFVEKLIKIFRVLNPHLYANRRR